MKKALTIKPNTAFVCHNHRFNDFVSGTYMKRNVNILTLAGLLVASISAQATVLAEAKGDLDGDGQAEWVVVSDTGRPSANDLGTLRKLEVFKMKGSQRTLWQSSTQVILPSQGGGMMGDPFQSIDIKKGSLFVEQAGGSAWKWSFRDQYRFQNGQFELIGYQSNSGRPCSEWTEVDANLQTGKIHYVFKDEQNDPDCGTATGKAQKPINETFVNRNIKLNFKNRHAQSVHVITPKSKKEIYFTSGD